MPYTHDNTNIIYLDYIIIIYYVVYDAPIWLYDYIVVQTHVLLSPMMNSTSNVTEQIEQSKTTPYYIRDGATRIGPCVR